MPLVGDWVHYVAHGTPIREDGTQAYPSACRAAMITEVGAWVADPGDPHDLCQFFDRAVDHLESSLGLSNDLVAELQSWTDQGQRIRLEKWLPDACHLDIRNPTGGFFKVCLYDKERTAGGTWHWPDKCKA